MIHNNADVAQRVGHQHGWNKLEILAQGNRIRVVCNGTLIVDWRDPEPHRIRAGPIGLQCHSNPDPRTPESVVSSPAVSGWLLRLLQDSNINRPLSVVFLLQRRHVLKS